MRAQSDEVRVVRRFNDGLMKGKVLFVAQPVIGDLKLHTDKRTTDHLQIFRRSPHGCEPCGRHLDSDDKFHDQGEAVPFLDGDVLHSKGLPLIALKHVGTATAPGFDDSV